MKNLYGLLPLLLLFQAPVALANNKLGVMAGYTYCTMRQNGATHNDAFRQVYTITKGGKGLTQYQQTQQMNLFAAVVINQCRPFARDFESFNP